MMVIVFFYGLFYEIWSNSFFTFGSYTMIQLNAYCVYNQFLEIFIIVFCRTRITLFYFPKIITVFNLYFIIYYESHFYPFGNEALFLLGNVTALLCFIVLKYFECPALDLNPFAPNTPSIDNPRQVYIPVLKSNCMLGFDIWTQFFSPALRVEFDEEEQKELNRGMNESMFDFSVAQRIQQNGDNNERQELLLAG